MLLSTLKDIRGFFARKIFTGLDLGKCSCKQRKGMCLIYLLLLRLWYVHIFIARVSRLSILDCPSGFL